MDGDEFGFEEADNVANDFGPEDENIVYKINVDTFEELKLPPPLSEAVKESWADFLSSQESRTVAGEAVYAALFEGAVGFQQLFTTPRAVQAVKFIAGLQNFVQLCDQPAVFKAAVETLAFGHLNLEVTVPRVVLFRDALVGLLETELESKFSSAAEQGWMTLLSYIGGALIYVRVNYAQRLRILSDSWKAANQGHKDTSKDKQVVVVKKKKKVAEDAEKTGDNDSNEGGTGDRGADDSGSDLGKSNMLGNTGTQEKSKFGLMSRIGNFFASSAQPNQQQQGVFASEGDEDAGQAKQVTQQSMVGSTDVPKTFEEMFQWNCAVMGLSSRTWMQEILGSFDAIVVHVADSARLTQECSVLSIKLAKCNWQGPINLAEYKSCMLAALRSLLPKVWDSNYEVAWNWLWDNVESILKQLMGQPLVWEKALQTMMASFQDADRYEFRKHCYDKFFTAAPAGQDYFKQSNTRLHFIADRVMQSTLEIFADPWRMVDEISALGLRHVGFGIPTELFGPFVTACIEVLIAFTDKPEAIEAYRWSLGLISRMLVQTITEGSTIVMKAINMNSAKQMAKAVSCAPRGKRAQWVLIVQVGTQDISPLSWAIESSSLEAAKAMLEDLLTIRADRERYYYGIEELFARHGDIVGRICEQAPGLLDTFLEGLVWRSRVTKDGMRRVNYYIKRLMMDKDGKFAEGLGSLCKNGDPKTISHPALVVLSDILWSGVVLREFVRTKSWFVLSLALFIVAQTVYAYETDISPNNYVVLICRIIIYLMTMTRLLWTHSRNVYRSYKSGKTARTLGIPVPAYIKTLDGGASVMLTILLVAMCATEPFFHCAGSDDWPCENCLGKAAIGLMYSHFAFLAMLLHWMLMVEYAVFSTGLSAFVLVLAHIKNEIGKFLVAVAFSHFAFAAAISCLEHNYDDFYDFFYTSVGIFSITLRLYEDDWRDWMDDYALIAIGLAYMTVSQVVMLNLLIAQLGCSYVYIYGNMLGFARLKRGSVMVDMLHKTSDLKWTRFTDSLGLDKPLEFNEGDIGMAGGVQILEPQSANTVTKDRILRYGGSCDPEIQWPEEHNKADEEEEQLEKLEKMIKTTLKRLSTKGRKGHGGSKGEAGSGGSQGSGGSAAGSQASMNSGGGSQNEDF